ncbi:RHS repeat-associated core domain-containing protein [Flavobacterium sp. j3]|uniref:RHS repeat-associated core domain-containing protein n=1 Tax=Flavobacterium aureirubrum TaxID=3133147 RepID=A0ABU9NBX6_9FLAO
MIIGNVRLNNLYYEYKVSIENNRLRVEQIGGIPQNQTMTAFNSQISTQFYQPVSSVNNVPTILLESLCYQYRYDDYNRLVEKKLPGKDWEFIVYDKLDRVVATGPALSPFTDMQSVPPATPIVGWIITKYDAFNRPILTGWLPSTTVTSAGRATLQSSQNTATILSETKSTSNSTINTVAFRYTNTAWPTSAYHVLTVNYYDDYSTNLTFNPVMSFTSSISPNPVFYNDTTNKSKGLPTITWTRIPELSTTTPIKAEMSYMLYDNKGRAVRTFTNNYLGGFTQVDSQLEPITGRVNYTLTTHKRLAASAVITVRDDFAYSDQDRLRTHTHSINGATPQLLAENTYDELGQLLSKKVGNTSALPLQKVDYRYNIRGWLTDINNTSSLSEGTNPQDLFAFKINYNSTITNNEGNTIVPLYNGNIAETTWLTNTDNVLRRYGYSYDNLNRLKKAVYQKPNTSVPVPQSYNESISYDKNGNIVTLQRNGDLDSGNTVIEIDNLAYIYNGNISNQLMKVFDGSRHPAGFDDDSIDGLTDPVNDYAYDALGNMISDQNKGITSISYNHLNLPIKIIFNNNTNTRIEYLYTANGQKTQKKVYTSSTEMTTTDYLGGFQYSQINANTATLNFFPHAEGYVNNTVVNGNNVYSYVFNYTDHLGNIRLRYTIHTNGTLRVLEQSHYYPFGLKHEKYNTDQFGFIPDPNGGYNSGVTTGRQLIGRIVYQYKYNGKEYQDELGLNMYDYGARNYDPAIGRWMNIDPLADERDWMTPYNFVQNSPILRFDPKGLTDFTFNKKTGEVTQVGDKNDEPDRILKTDSKGNVKKKGEGFLGFLVSKSEKGKAKVDIDNIEQGILSDGMNLKENDNLIDVGGKGQATVKGFEEFALKFSNYIGREIAGGYFSEKGKSDINHISINSYKSNTSTSATGGIVPTRFTNDKNLLQSLQLRVHYHTHLSKFDDKSRLTPSTDDDKVWSNLPPGVQGMIITNPENVYKNN